MTSNQEPDAVRTAMTQVFPAHDERVALFYQMQEYHLGWRNEALTPTSADSGKLIRPHLCRLACEVVGGEVARAEPLAAAIQLLHDFTLIHDDIQDHSATRRGRPTVWNLWGVSQGINTGDGMFTLAQQSVLRLVDVGVSASVVVEIARRFNETVLHICEGQYLDMSFEDRLDITEADYLAMISRKTAALIAAATSLGAVLGEADANQAMTLFDFGESLGLAFQIEDDILGIWGAEGDTGKPEAHDLWGRKKSLPVIHALSHADLDEGATLRRIYTQPELSAADVTMILTILTHTGSRGYSEGVARFYHEAAVAALDKLRAVNIAALAEMRQTTAKLLGRAR